MTGMRGKPLGRIDGPDPQTARKFAWKTRESATELLERARVHRGARRDQE